MAVKTNAMRIIESAGINFQAFEYDISDGMIDAVSIARKIGRSSEEYLKLWSLKIPLTNTLSSLSPPAPNSI